MGKAVENYYNLTGPQKAAILMMSLQENHVSKILSLMEDEEIRELSIVMTSLGTVPSATVEKLFLEFASAISGPSTMIGNFENTERLLLKTLPKDRVASIMEEIRGPAGKTMWDKLGNINEQVLANYLKNEYPQTVAVILSKIKPDHSARVLALLPESFAMDVIMRLLRMEAIQKDVLDGLEQTLRTEFMNNLAHTTRQDSHELIAEMFNNMDRNAEGRFMAALEERNRESAERIKSLMFTFEDLTRLDSLGIQVLLRNVDKEKLSIALKGASDVIKDLFFKNMSERAGKMMREDMEALGPVRLRDVDDAQAVIVQTAKDLANNGEITISEGGSQDELIY
ncbi:MAG: flagellar motor switch protein FliG [Alphaproteobacteria bacterium]|nr:flagellar motor switch protein FliG [Alphaproteobacteria bacterium]